MKHYVYSDDDTIYSYLAQINNGLPNSKQTETGDSITTEKTQEEHPDKSTTKITFKVPPFFEAELGSYDNFSIDSKTISQTSVGREILSKSIHDNAYDMLEKHLRTDLGISGYTTDSTIGDYIEISGKLQVFDLSVFSQFSKKNFGHIYEAISLNKIDEALRTLNRQQKRESTVDKKIKDAKKETEQTLNSVYLAVDFIEYIKNVLPSDKYIIYKDLFIPLCNKNMREDFNAIRYKYTFESRLVGRITGTFKDIIQFYPGNAFDAIFKARDEFLIATLELLSISNDFKVVNPLCWYFE